MSRASEPGLLEAVARVGSSVFGMLQNRLELAGIELGEARERLVVTIVASFAALLLLGGAAVALTAWIAAAVWATTGPAVLGWIALAYASAGVGLLLWLRTKLRREPTLLAETLAELRTDAAMLRGEPKA
jgi:uncharacterized membrane protein YqjE